MILWDPYNSGYSMILQFFSNGVKLQAGSMNSIYPGADLDNSNLKL